MQLYDDGNGNQFIYNVDGTTQEITISIAYINVANTHLVIPSQIDGKNVVAIGANAFHNSDAQQNTLTITFPTTLKRIEDKAFIQCTSLQSVNLHETQVTSIGDVAFEGNTALQSIQFPATLETIGDNAFNNTNLTQTSFLGNPVSRGGNLRSIGQYAFSNTNIANYDSNSWSYPQEIPAWLEPFLPEQTSSASGDPYISPFFVL